MKSLYLAWQDPISREWFPVGKLSFDAGVYRFMYTRGAQKSRRFVPFGRMQKLDAVYESTELFPLFANRLLPKSRPEYKDLLQWLDVREDEDDPIALLALTEGHRRTDSLEVFRCPEPDQSGYFHIHFFSHGIRHLSDDSLQRISELAPPPRLFLMHDLQNPFDHKAIALRTDDPPTIVGYCPRYLTQELIQLINGCGYEAATVTVERVNLDAPTELRLLCSMTACWPDEYRPCSNELFEPLVPQANLST